MARVKRYWIRYNKGADRLEQQITIGTLRPNGPGWVEVDVDHCCNTIESCSEQEVTAILSAVPEDFTCTFYLTVNGVRLGELELTVASTLEQIVEALNTFYVGTAVFTIENATTGLVKAVTAIPYTVTLESLCLPTP